MSGSGKTTAARRIAARVDVPFHELDMLAFGPNWSTAPRFVESVEQIVAEPAWVFDSWGYPQVRDAMWAAADTIVWLDFPARVVLPHLVHRSLVRTVTRAEIFNGNRETWSGWLSKDHPVWHALTSFEARRKYLADRIHGATSQHTRTFRFTRRREFDRWLGTLGRKGAAGQRAGRPSA